MWCRLDHYLSCLLKHVRVHFSLSTKTNDNDDDDDDDDDNDVNDNDDDDDDDDKSSFFLPVGKILKACCEARFIY